MTSPTFCCLPFMHLATHPNGAVGLCCEASTEGRTLSNNPEARRPAKLGQDPLDKIVNSVNFNEYRQQMLSGQWPKPCITCQHKEQQGQNSKRLRENARWLPIISADELAQRTDVTGKLNKIDFAFIELRLANTCNSACITCNPVSSSRWIPDAEKLQTMLFWYQNHYTNENNWTKNLSVFEEIADHAHSLREIYINGGEPTLIPEHYALLDKLISNKSSQNIRLHYSINCTRLPNELMDLWLRFREVNVSCSIDEIGDRNSYIRYPTDWDTVINTIDSLMHHRSPNIKIGITQTISIFNAHRTDQFNDFVKKQWPGVYVYKNILREPSYLQSETLELDKFKEFITAMDSIRNTDFRSTFPELAHLYE